MKTSEKRNLSKKAFSLVEVVLAIGVLSLAVVALLGLFGPTMSSVKQVIDTNEATAVVHRVNAEIQREMTFTQVFDAANTGAVYFVWKEQSDIRGPVDFVMNTSDDPMISARDNGELVGTPFVVTFSRGLTNSGYWSGDPGNTEGYVPVLVNIFAVSPERIQNGGTGLINVSGAGINFNTSDLKESDLIFSYTAGKTRSL